MSQRDNTYYKLEEFSGSDYQIVEGEPNDIGWKVRSDVGTSVGEVVELLFDPRTRAVRYLIVDVEDEIASNSDAAIPVPIGIAHLHTSDDEVVLPNIHAGQFATWPRYNRENFGPDTENNARE